MNDKDLIQVGFTTDDSRLKQGMEESAQSVERAAQRMRESMERVGQQTKQAAEQMQSSLKDATERINSAFASVQGTFLAFTAVLAGGGALKGVIGASAEWAGEATKLSKALGITTEQASIMNVALNHLGMDSQMVISASMAMTRQIHSNGQAFTTLGVDVRNANGQYRPSVELMMEVNQKLAAIKNTTAQNEAGMQIYGRQWAELRGLIRLTGEQMEWAEKRAKELGLIVGPEGAAMARAYKEQVRDLQMVGKSLEVQFGNALLPVFTKLGGWMSSEGPQAGKVFGNVLESVAKAGMTVCHTFEALGKLIAGVAATARVALSGNVSGAKDVLSAMKTDIDDIDARWKKALENFDKPIKASAVPHPNDSPNYDFSKGGKGGKDSRVGEWEARLIAARDAFERSKLMQNSFQQFSKEMERDYWKGILETERLSVEERRAIEAKYYAAEREMRKHAFDAEIADLKAKKDSYKQGSVERIQIAGEEAARIGERYGFESREFKAAQGEMTKAARDRTDRLREIDEESIERTRQHNIHLIEMERARIEIAKSLGEMSATQEAEALRELKAQEYQIELKALQDKAALYDLDDDAYRKLLDKIAALKEKHDTDMAKATGKVAREQKKELDKLLDPFSNAFDKSVNGMIQGTLTFQKAVRQAMQSVALEFSNLGVKIGTEWLKTELFKTKATAAGTAERTALEKATAGESIMIAAGSAIKQILIDAYEAMAGAFSAIVGIPVVGPELAPAAAGAAFATVAGYAASIPSAEGGWDIPAGATGLMRYHEREMMLPAKYADKIRDLAERGDAGGSGHMTINISAMDARSVRDYFRHNANTLAPALRTLARNFTPIKGS